MDIHTHLTEYAHHMRSENKKPITITNTISMLGLFFRVVAKSLVDITSADIIDYLGRKTISQSTRRTYYILLSGFFTWLLYNHRILANPLKNIEPPSMPKSMPKRIMTKKQTATLLNAFELNEDKVFVYRNRVILELMYCCSLRRGEVVRLTVDDIDYSQRVLRVKVGKTGVGRLVPVGQQVIDLLQKYLEKIRGALCKNIKTKALFVNYRGNPLCEQAITRMVWLKNKELKIRSHPSSHSFRKSSATHMLRNGAPLEVVQQLLGHSDIESTKHYTKLYPRDIIKMHKAFHPRERQKNMQMPELHVPTKLYTYSKISQNT